MPKYVTTHIDPKHVRWFVTGAVTEHCIAIGAGSRPTDRTPFEGYISETLDVVWGYMRGTKTLDGSCSDLQCDLAIEARKVFKPALYKDAWKLEIGAMVMVPHTLHQPYPMAAAIKRCRELTGMDLQSAHDACHALKAELDKEAGL